MLLIPSALVSASVVGGRARGGAWPDPGRCPDGLSGRVLVGGRRALDRVFARRGHKRCLWPRGPETRGSGEWLPGSVSGRRATGGGARRLGRDVGLRGVRLVVALFASGIGRVGAQTGRAEVGRRKWTVGFHPFRSWPDADAVVGALPIPSMCSSSLVA